MNDETKPRRPGRPRVHPKGTTATDRARMAEAARRESGGHRFSLALDQPAWDALQRLAPARDRGRIIADLILAAAKKQRTGVKP